MLKDSDGDEYFPNREHKCNRHLSDNSADLYPKAQGVLGTTLARARNAQTDM